LRPIPGLTGKRLTFGGVGTKVKGVPVDVIVRDDKYAALYEEAILASRNGVVTPPYLAAMKMAAGRPKDESDLIYLISNGQLGDFKATERIIRKHLGPYAVDSFEGYAFEAAIKRALGTERGK